MINCGIYLPPGGNMDYTHDSLELPQQHRALEELALNRILRDAHKLALIALELPMLSPLAWTIAGVLDSRGPCLTIRVRGTEQDASRFSSTVLAFFQQQRSSGETDDIASLPALLKSQPQEDCFLLLDQAHLIQWGTEFSDLLQRLLLQCSPQLHILLLSHAPIPFLREADCLPRSMVIATPKELVPVQEAAHDLLQTAYPTLLERDRQLIYTVTGGWISAMDAAAELLLSAKNQTTVRADHLLEQVVPRLRDLLPQSTADLWDEATATCMELLCVEKSLPESLALLLTHGDMYPLRQLSRQQFLVHYQQAVDPVYRLNPILQFWLYCQTQRRRGRGFLLEQHRIVAQYAQENRAWNLVFYHQLRRGYVEEAAATLRHLIFSEVDTALLDEYRLLLRDLPPASVDRLPWVQLGYALSMKYRHPNIAFHYLDRAIALFQLEHNREGVVLACCQKISMGFFAHDQRNTPREFLRILSEDDFPDGELDPILDGYRKVFTAYAIIQLGQDAGRAVALLEQAQETALFQENSNLHLWVYYVMIVTYRDCPYSSSLRSILDEALRLIESPEVQKPLKMCFYQAIAFLCYIETGHYQQAGNCCEQAAYIATEISATGYRFYINMIHAYALDCLGRFQRAEQIILDTAQVSGGLLNIRNEHLRAYYSIGQSYHYFLKGEHDLAMEHAEKALTLAAGSERTSYLVRALLVMGNLLVERGEIPRAQQMLDQALALTQRRRYEFYRLSALFLKAQILQKSGNRSDFNHCMALLAQSSKDANIYHYNFARPQTICKVAADYTPSEKEQPFFTRLIAYNEQSQRPVSLPATQIPGANTPIQVCILGPTMVLLDGVPLEPCASAKALHLLRVLALSPQPVDIHKLIAAIWGDQEEKSARNNFYFTLHQLRGYLRHKGAVLYRRGQCCLSPDLVTVDAVEFQHLTEAARSYIAAGNLDSAAYYFAQAIRLDRGPVLDDADLLDDLLLQRESLERAVCTALREYGETCLLCHHPDLGEEILSRAVQRPFADESTYRSYMKAKYLCGNKSGALSAYERLCQQLHTEFSAEPHRLTRELADRIRRNQEINDLREL